MDLTKSKLIVITVVEDVYKVCIKGVDVLKERWEGE
jgi:hypothetical protein